MSINVDKTTDISTKGKLSGIIHLDRKGEEVERFLKSFDVSSDRLAAAAASVVEQFLSKCRASLKNKLSLQKYDRASVMSGHNSGVQQILLHSYLCAYFFHCAAHRLNLVLCQ